MEKERGSSLEVYKGPQLRAAHRISMFEKKIKKEKYWNAEILALSTGKYAS